MANNYDDVWGGIEKTGRTILIQDRYVSQAATVVAWAGMICFFMFAILALATKSYPVVIAMVVSIGVWTTAGTIVIRVKRRERKVLTLEK